MATWQAFVDATGVKIIDGIGSTEMLHIFISAADDDIVPGSTGKPVPGYSATVLDEHGDPVPAGEVGRLAVKGPTGCRYLADSRQTVYVQDGWNITGDTFIRDERGYFWYQARSDDMIVSAGYNIAARGQLVKAFVVLRDGVAADEAMVKTLQDFTKLEIAPYKYPRAIEFVDALPRGRTGKLQRFRLRQPADR